MRHQQLSVLAGTWNVNTTRAAMQSVNEWLGKRAQTAHIVCVGLQVSLGNSLHMDNGHTALPAVLEVLVGNLPGVAHVSPYPRCVVCSNAVYSPLTPLLLVLCTCVCAAGGGDGHQQRCV